jgi:Lar family restriction alleviation protein
MTEKLLPCPFCGGESLLRDRYINGAANTKHYIRECRHCKATFAHWFRSIKKANEAWNRRADAVPVVRCEECSNKEEHSYYCLLHSIFVRSDFFCKDGGCDK